jgi:hypothetical protein
VIAFLLFVIWASVAQLNQYRGLASCMPFPPLHTAATAAAAAAAAAQQF